MPNATPIDMTMTALVCMLLISAYFCFYFSSIVQQCFSCFTLPSSCTCVCVFFLALAHRIFIAVYLRFWGFSCSDFHVSSVFYVHTSTLPPFFVLHLISSCCTLSSVCFVFVHIRVFCLICMCMLLSTCNFHS